jgi:hypothetical protein
MEILIACGEFLLMLIRGLIGIHMRSQQNFTGLLLQAQRGITAKRRAGSSVGNNQSKY